MAPEVEWHPSALDDAHAIAAFIARDSASYAAAFVDRLLEATRRLPEFPEVGRSVPEWSERSVREIYVHQYRVIYVVHPDRILVLAVIHGARLLPTDLRDLRTRR